MPPTLLLHALYFKYIVVFNTIFYPNDPVRRYSDTVYLGTNRVRVLFVHTDLVVRPVVGSRKTPFKTGQRSYADTGRS